MGHSICASLEWLIGATILNNSGQPYYSSSSPFTVSGVLIDEAKKEKRDGNVLNFFCLA